MGEYRINGVVVNYQKKRRTGVPRTNGTAAAMISFFPTFKATAIAKMFGVSNSRVQALLRKIRTKRLT